MKKSKPKGGRSFDSVPADDGFRNYMSRKIELQRKQFGLVLPPPPDSPIETSHNSDEDKHMGYSASNEESERNAPSARSTSDSPSRKSVRFHTNLEHVAPITSVSDVLENLKQRHSVKKSSLRRRRYDSSEKRDDPTDKAQSTSTSASMEGVLKKLHSRYDRSLKRKHPKSILETLGTCDDLNCSEDNIPTTQFDDVQTTKPLTQIDTLSTELGNNLLETGDGDFDLDHQSKATGPLHITSLQTDINQAMDIVKKSSIRPDLFFSGVVVLINGHTNPDATTLMRLLHKHGGDLEKYETRRVTHIIAERLSTAKANIYKSQNNPTPVVRPEWITDSVENGMLLPFGDYLLADVMEAKTPGTKSLKTFFGSEKASDEEMEVNRWADTDPSKSNYHINGQVRTVGNDPNFLESYFSSSRLSYIGSFKHRVKTTEGTSHRKQIAGSKRFVLLVDMDCFFASVALKNFPQYRNCPVAVGHSPTVELKTPEGASGKVPSPSKTLQNSSSELSTCNYIARKFGVKKGMFLGDAIKLCPQLVVLPYDFPQYESISSIVAEKLHAFADQFNGSVEQVSCDESYLEVHVTPEDYDGRALEEFLSSLAEHIRNDIFEATECTASIGVASNKFLAKLAADKVKPDASSVVRDYRELVDGLALRDLHGIGRKIEKKLNIHSLHTVNDIWDLGDDAERVLSEVIGAATSHKIVQFCYGNDDRPVTPQVRRTIGAECNYGVRFEGPYGPDHMMKGLAKELEKRMTSVAVLGSKLTLKLMKSKDVSKVPGKFLGHGLCEHLSKSMDIQLTRSCNVICSAGMKLFQKMGVDKDAIRGMGLVVSSLEPDTGASNTSSPSKLDSWLQSGVSRVSTETMTDFVLDGDIEDDEAEDIDRTTTRHSNVASMPTYSQLDQDVLTELPEDILKEVQLSYGKLATKTAGRPSFASPKSKRRREKPLMPGQVSVKRMFKLNSVKTGEEKLQCDNKEFTLSQLDCLPLETQLRIANNDDVKITKSAAPSQKADGASRTLVNSIILPSSQTEGGNDDITTSACDLFRRSRDFYHENILPLQEFIESTENPESDDVKSVIDFLFVCIEERRVKDVVVFLRVIKNMQHGWNETIYEQIKETVVDEIQRLNGGCYLDTVWLGL